MSSTNPQTALAPIPRPIPGRGTNKATSFSIIGSRASTILFYILNNTRPFELHNILSNAVHRMSPAETAQLLAALTPTGIVTGRAYEATNDANPRHCMRCHRQYVEIKNSHSACHVPHDKPQVRLVQYPYREGPDSNRDGDKLKKERRPSIIEIDDVPKKVDGSLELCFPCCGLVVAAGDNYDSHCYKGRHTSLFATVKYNGSNFKQCAQAGCCFPVLPAPTVPTARV